MTRASILLTAILLLGRPLCAAEPEEVAVETRPFAIRHTFTASALPGTCTPLQLAGAAWSDFTLTRIAAHGSRVAKGETLAAFDPRDIDRKILDTRVAIESKTLEIAQAELDLKHLEDTTPHQLQKLQRAADDAHEENEYFTSVRRKAEEESADQKLKRAEQTLENQREELRQLRSMYEADDLTEETEEIILKRQQNRVEEAEFDLRMEQLAQVRTREVRLPREALKLADAQRDTALALAKFTAESPRAIALKKLELQNLKTTLEREQQTLADLEADRKQIELTAPTDGWFYHGTIENGRWSAGDAAKVLVVHGRPPVRRPFATFIPADERLRLIASLDAACASQLTAGANGVAWLAGREDAEFAVKLTSLAAAPDADGRFMAEMSAEWPAGLALAPATTVNVMISCYDSPQAIVLPVKALEPAVSGWSVAIKLADGKTERRPVKRGRVFNGECEILGGLDPGQVVVIP